MALAADGMKHHSDQQGARHRLASLFEARSVALVGASDKSLWSTLIHRNFGAYGFGGKLYAVNRGGAEAHGLPGYRSCVEIGEPVDVAFLFVPQEVVLSALEDAAAAGIRNVAILTSGYAEIGPEGTRMQEELLSRAEALGVLVWGPNSLGFNNIAAQFPLSSIPALKPILPPSIAIVSQSGATASELYEFAQSQNIGISLVATTGNEGHISLVDVIDYLVDQKDAKAIAVFAEMIRNPARFVEVAERAKAKAKPIVILKIGRSQLATAVAQAHTGSLVGDDRVFEAMCERCGVIRVTSPEDLINTAGLVAATGPIRERGMRFLSISGGACTLVADGAEAAGVELPASTPETVAALREILPVYASTLNPLDITGAAIRDPDLFARVIPIIAREEGIGVVTVGMTVPNVENQGVPQILDAIGRAVATIDKPAILVSTCGKSLNDITRKSIADYGLPPIITGIDPMLRAVGKIMHWSAQLDRRWPSATPRPGDLLSPRPSTERETLDYMAGFSVPVVPARIVRSAAEAIAAATDLGDMVVLKVASADIQHKTDIGGVRLRVVPADAGSAFDGIMASVTGARPDAVIDGVIVSPMRSGGIELIVGVTHDPNWGPVIAVGLGGVLVELLDDAALALLPVDREGVVNMLNRLRGSSLLEGFRGAAAVDINAVADAVVKIGEAALALGPSLNSLEINPLLVSADHIEALDALAIWS